MRYSDQNGHERFNGCNNAPRKNDERLSRIALERIVENFYVTVSKTKENLS